ncbi:UDP-N-acetylmuramate--L-alanine ligase [Halomicronema hongdechloris C2206]|uniref:Lipid II isoglutaminyl synthase (glutamine-hydrolyzing) subunit MurT n=1 Tax=Halomicronema hongdechloris C2206 TaxID=1641165 RepID=A0A1Z3HTF3_9CYAN|nr:Mur ligase family protein [Halomicronema hongdechloris]ASC73611.1 UDP-N-acetylmuramate--L-alanine ligase [Halomicronema hongdechloris C2206]
MKAIVLIPIVVLAKLLIRLLRLSGRGSGTALPGLLVNRYFPFVFPALVAQIPYIIVITGTNGKTTTQTMLSAILGQRPQMRVLRNQAGANLSQGILSQLLRQADLRGRLQATHAIFEVEEATLPRIARLLRPDIIAVTNLYRDQLDAYGETDMTEKLIRDGIGQCPQATVVLNGNDPRTARLTQGLANPTYWIALTDAIARQLPYEGTPRATDSLSQNILRATQIQIQPDLTSTCEVSGVLDDQPISGVSVKVLAPGFFHVYNALTALAIAQRLGLTLPEAAQGLQRFNPAFGRGEILVKRRGGTQVCYQVLLIKNPAGFTLTLELLKRLPALKLLLIINDNTADGKDVSWLWDSELERLQGADLAWILCSGIRAKDMAVRLKYALAAAPGSPCPIAVCESIPAAIDQTCSRGQDGDTIYVLPTYTAMLAFRKAMGKVLE